MDTILYKLTRIKLSEKIDDNIIEVEEQDFGYFTSIIEFKNFILHHNDEQNCIFICKTYVLNPRHSNQVESCITICTYDINANIICNCSTNQFNVHKKDINGEKLTWFMGRDVKDIKLNDIIWFYDIYSQCMYQGVVKGLPFNTEEVKQRMDKNNGYNNLNYLDDSFIIYPTILDNDIDSENHEHILSCFIFTKEFINNFKLK